MPFNFDHFSAHPIHGFLGVISLCACFLGVAVEIIRAVLSLQAIHRVGATVTINAFNWQRYPDCSGLIRGTDYPYQPASYVATPLFHIIQAFILLLLGFSEWPTIQWFLPRLSWMLIWKPESDVWATGALQIWFGLSILSKPAAILGNYQEIWLIFITGWLLFCIGLINFFVGLLRGNDIRKMRGQFIPNGGGGGPSKEAKAKDAWNQLKAALDAVVGQNINIGAMFPRIGQMDKAVGDL